MRCHKDTVQGCVSGHKQLVPRPHSGQSLLHMHTRFRSSCCICQHESGVSGHTSADLLICNVLYLAHEDVTSVQHGTVV